MLININLAKEIFSEYVKKYDYKDKQVKLKITHIERVSQMAKKLAIELSLSEEDIKLAELIRDADKLDIFYNLTFEDKSAVWGKDDISNEIISDEIYREYIENRAINYSHMNTGADLLVANFAYVYNLYFKQSLIFLKNKNYLEKIYKRFDFNDRITKERYENVYKQVKTYIDKKIC